MCRQKLPLTVFNKQAKSADGRQGYCRTCQKAHKLKYRYGISVEELTALLESQNGACAICATDLCLDFSGKVSFVVDHSHTTGAVRGILCNSCNIVLGHARDDVAVLRRAIQYLEERSKR